MICGAELAIDSACAPSCCCTCRAWRLALSLAKSASTRLPTPVVSTSVSLEMQVACPSICLYWEPRLPSAWLVRLIELVTCARMFVAAVRPDEHTSELQSLMRTSYADFC